MHLNEAQNAFCHAAEGNIRLLAPAGCGKTLSILYRCAHLAEHDGQSRPRFLIVVFTRAARDELQSRLDEDDRFTGIRDTTEIATLNSWGYRRIKTVAFSPRLITGKKDYHFTVLNQLQPVWQRHDRIKEAIEKSRNLAPRILMDVTDAFKSLGFDHQRHSSYELFSQHIDRLESQELAWRLEDQFNELTKLGVLEAKTVKGGSEVPKAGRADVFHAFYQFWCEATEHLIGNATFTLEDQKYVAYLDERRKVDEGSFLSGAARYSHIFVDEFQDINPLDLNLVYAITQRNRATLTVAGDDDQAIFEWRGATPEYVLDPGKFFNASFTTYILDKNYRSPANIVKHSQLLIEHNQRRVPKQTTAVSEATASIDVIRMSDLSKSLDYVYGVVHDAVSTGVSPAQVAIIGRKRSQIIPYQVYFASKDISFCAAEDLSLFLSETFERLLGLIGIKTRASERQTTSQVVSDIVQLCDLVKRYPLNKKDKQNVRRYLQDSRPTSVEAAVTVLANYRGSLKGPNADGHTSEAMTDAITNFVAAGTVTETLETLSTHFGGLQIDMGKAEDDIFYTDPPFLQLADFASSYGDHYDQFVDDIERAKDKLVYVPPFSDKDQGTSANGNWKQPVHLMTALRAKGKEFDTVILLDVVSGIWPNKNANTPAKLEAERRVFYVAFTRARKRVVMLISSRTGSAESVDSPYLEELGLPAG